MGEVHNESMEFKVAAKRMWEGLIKDAHNCLPKALPHQVLGIEYPLGQHGFSLPGAVRVIKYCKVIEDDLDKAEAATKKFLHEQAVHAKAELEKVAHKEVALVQEKVKKMEEAGLVKENHLVAKEMVSATLKAIDTAEKVLHNEGAKDVAKVGSAAHKVGKLVELEVMEVKEKIEEVDHEACKITMSVIGGGLLGILFLHYKHTFHVQDIKEGVGSILHWTSEFEALSKSLSSLEEHKKHVFDTFHGVEAYLLKNIDHYAH